MADSTEICKVTLWEENIGKFETDQSYTLQNFLVREFASTKSLSLARDGSDISSIPDIGEVAHEDKLSDVL